MSLGDIRINRQAVRNAVRSAIGQSPYNEDIQFVVLREAKIGDPIPVVTPQGKPAFWLIPLLAGDWACGFATVGLGGNVTRLGIFGGAPNDRPAWVKADFFIRPPGDILAEIEAHYPGRELSLPVFSYDSNPARWGWMMSITQPDVHPVVIFITPGGWYVQPTAIPGNFER